MKKSIVMWEGKFESCGPPLSDRNPPLLDHLVVQKIMMDTYRKGGDELLNSLCKTRRDFNAVCRNHLWYMEVFYMLMVEDFPREFVALLPRYFDRIDDSFEGANRKLNNWKGFYKASVKAQKALEQDIANSRNVRDGRVIETMKELVERRFLEPEIAAIYARLLYESKVKIDASDRIRFRMDITSEISGKDIALDVLEKFLIFNDDFSFLVDKQGLLFNEQKIYDFLVEVGTVSGGETAFYTILAGKYGNQNAIEQAIDQSGPKFDRWLDAFKQSFPFDNKNHKTFVYLAHALDEQYHDIVLREAGKKLKQLYLDGENYGKHQQWLEAIYLEIFSTMTRSGWSVEFDVNPLTQNNITNEKIKEFFEKSSSTPKALENWAIAVIRSRGDPSARKGVVLWLIQKLKEKLPQMKEYVKNEEVEYKREMEELHVKYAAIKDYTEAIDFIKQLG